MENLLNTIIFESIQEYEFATDIRKNLLEHFENLALRHLPGGWETDKATAKPNLSSAVFVSVKEDVGEVELNSAGDSVELSRNSQHLLEYSAISHLLEEDLVKLI